MSDDPLADPDTAEELPSLRDQVSLVNGVYHRAICYARIVRACGDGLYWADVAATPDFANTHRIILSEEDLYFALPYDVRVLGKTPTQIRTMMVAHAREVRPAQRWQRQSRQRIVNALPVWNDAQQTVTWQLTVGDPLTALTAA